MSDVHRSAATLLHRVADGGEIPIAVLREFAELVLHSELVVSAREHPQPTTSSSRADLSRPWTRRTPAPAATAFITWSSHLVRKTLAPALRATELRSWDDVHNVCGRFGVVVRLHGNGLVFEDAERAVRVKASCVGRKFSKPRLCKQLGDFRPASEHQLEDVGRAAHWYSPMPPTVPESLWKDYAQSLNNARLERQHAWSSYRESASGKRRGLKEKYRHQRGLLAVLLVSSRDRKRLSQQLALRQAIESRAISRGADRNYERPFGTL